MLGYRTTPIVVNPFLSKSVTEFWQRFNTRVHSWLECNVFRPCCARYGPMRALCVVFLVSGILHEIPFSIATSRIDGYRFTFFSLQAFAILVSRPIELAVTGNRISQFMLRLATIVRMWATSIFFFHGVNRVFPFFYASQP